MKKQFSLVVVIIFTLMFLSDSTVLARKDIAAFCYHQVEPVARSKFSLDRAKFVEQMEYLKNRGYRSLNSEELLAALDPDGPEVDRAVVITFDDGYKTVYDHAYPVMKSLGLKGIICIYPAFIGSKLAMTWEQMAELIKEGWSVECHSYTHANLSSKYMNPEAEKAFLEKEILTSRDKIERQLGNKVRFMVWPYGVYTDRTLKMVKDAGFAGAMTVDGGANYKGLSPYIVKRQVIYASDDMNKFLIRFGMAGLKVSQHYPEPGQVLPQLATFSCRIDDLADYSPEKYVLNAKATGKKVDFTFDQETRTLNARVGSAFSAGNYFIDIYLRDKRTGVTAQHGWLFSIEGKLNRTDY